MLLRSIMVGCVLMLLLMGASAPNGSCKMTVCADQGCVHFTQKFNQNAILKELSNVADLMEGALRSFGYFLPPQFGGSPYQRANVFVYFICLPMIAIGGAVVTRSRTAVEVFWAGLLVLAMFFQADGFLGTENLYHYGTEFCVRLGNLTGLTYRGICILIFVVGIPFALVCELVLVCKLLRSPLCGKVSS